MYRRDIWWPNNEIPLIFPVYASLALSRLVFLKLNNTELVMKQVLRIQDRAGFGPFCQGTYQSGLGLYHNDDILFPCTSTDFVIADVYSKGLSYRLACQNACLYLYWFGLFIPELVEHDYRLYKITIKGYIPGHSGKQCLYYQDDVLGKEIVW